MLQPILGHTTSTNPIKLAMVVIGDLSTLETENSKQAYQYKRTNLIG